MEKVGKGAFGIVYKALHFETGSFVAIKRMTKEGIDEKMLFNLKVSSTPLTCIATCHQCSQRSPNLVLCPSFVQSEIDLLKILDHKHIVKYLGLLDSDNHVNMILEFVPDLLASLSAVFPDALACAGSWKTAHSSR